MLDFHVFVKISALDVQQCTRSSLTIANVLIYRWHAWRFLGERSSAEAGRPLTLNMNADGFLLDGGRSGRSRSRNKYRALGKLKERGRERHIIHTVVTRKNAANERGRGRGRLTPSPTDKCRSHRMPQGIAAHLKTVVASLTYNSPL